MTRKIVSNRFLVGFTIIAISISAMGCATIKPTAQEIAKESALTPGMAKKYIYPGKTTQTEVLEIFGPPDLVTHKGGRDVWTYDKLSHEVSTSGGYLTILLAGVSGESGRRASRSIMLIIYFNESEVVMDYKLSSSKF